ncbi:MAG: hypothetical protein ACLVCW_02875 [Campylobacter sp.]
MLKIPRHDIKRNFNRGKQARHIGSAVKFHIKILRRNRRQNSMKFYRE